MTGIDVRHRKSCLCPRADGKCCNAPFQAHVWDARNNKRVRKTFPTKTAAAQWRTDAQRALREGDGVSTRGPKVKDAFGTVLAGMEAGTVLDRSGRRYKPSTIRGYRRDARNYLIPKLGHLRVEEVRRGDIQRVIDGMQASGAARSTCSNALNPLRALYRWAIDHDHTTRNPTKEIRLPASDAKPRRVVDPSAAEALLAALPEADRAAWAVAFYAGLRVGELRALRWTDVDLESGVLHVRHGWDDHEGEQDPKSMSGKRTIPLAGRLRSELVRHKLLVGGDSDTLVFGKTPTRAFDRPTFRNRALRAWGWKRALNPDTSRRVWVKEREDALEPLTPHECRHCAISYFALAGMSLKEAQTAAGHANIKTTMDVYAKALPGWQEGAAAKLDAFFGATASRQSPTPPERFTAVPQRFSVAG